MKNKRNKLIAIIMCSACILPTSISTASAKEYRALTQQITPITHAISNEHFDYTEGNLVIKTDIGTVHWKEFLSTDDIKDVYINDGVENIKSHAFDKCTKLQNVRIPDSVKQIESFAFSFCTSLQSIYLPEGITLIDTAAFSHCTSLQQIQIPRTLTVIHNSTFSNCTKLTKVTILANIKVIGKSVSK